MKELYMPRVLIAPLERWAKKYLGDAKLVGAIWIAMAHNRVKND